MLFIADLHTHGKYSGATSKQMVLPTMAKWARYKGLNLLGTGDITHPHWYEECKELLFTPENEETGIYPFDGIYWVLSTEIATIYHGNDGKLKKIHHIILYPNFEVARLANEHLSRKGSLSEDGRPTLSNYSSAELTEDLSEIDSQIEIIPAHIWTPWFSVFGSKFGYESIKDCYEDQIKKVHCIETGLSSDPEMNWRLSELNNFTIISNSDCHSPWPWRMGREATLFNSKPTYKAIISTLRKNEIQMTIEVDPNYGKYHLDGHRKCNIRLDPKESKKYENICPRCKKALTIGVLHRVEHLADHPRGYRPSNAKDFKKLLPLAEILKHYLKVKNLLNKNLLSMYVDMVKYFGNELEILLWKEFGELSTKIPQDLVNIIKWNRNQEIQYSPGYDGVYGIPIFPERDSIQATTRTRRHQKKQRSLTDFF